jgi:3-oxoadipate enol-lactonase
LVRVRTDDGVELEATVAGSGPGLLLVHGFGGAKEDFADHVDALAVTHTVVTFDHRGHGASDKPSDPEAYSLDRLARDTLAVADAAGLASFRLLGHSMGGMVARTIALTRAERVDALVMMDTTAGPIPGFDPALIDIAADVAIEQGKAALKELLDLAKTLETPAHVRVCDERPGYIEFNERKWEDVSPVMWGTLARAMARQSDDNDAMSSVACPVLVIVGEQDKPFVHASHRMIKAMPHAMLVIVPGAGHSPQFENAGAWLAAMLEFLASVPASIAS